MDNKTFTQRGKVSQKNPSPAGMRQRLEKQIKETVKRIPGAREQVLGFIMDFSTHAADTEEGYSIICSTFRAGYCWHFAHLLQAAFQRGTVCWAAPFGHFIWMDDNRIPYDIEGVYSGEAFYFIPESYLNDEVEDFLHIPGVGHGTTQEEIMAVIRRYEDDCGFSHQDGSIRNYCRHCGEPEVSREEALNRHNRDCLELERGIKKEIDALRQKYQDLRKRYILEADICPARYTVSFRTGQALTCDCMADRRTGEVFEIDGAECLKQGIPIASETVRLPDGQEFSIWAGSGGTARDRFRPGKPDQFYWRKTDADREDTAGGDGKAVAPKGQGGTPKTGIRQG